MTRRPRSEHQPGQRLLQAPASAGRVGEGFEVAGRVIGVGGRAAAGIGDGGDEACSRYRVASRVRRIDCYPTRLRLLRFVTAHASFPPFLRSRYPVARTRLPTSELSYHQLASDSCVICRVTRIPRFPLAFDSGVLLPRTRISRLRFALYSCNLCRIRRGLHTEFAPLANLLRLRTIWGRPRPRASSIFDRVHR
jgi:hypothetical protein